MAAGKPATKQFDPNNPFGGGSSASATAKSDSASPESSNTAESGSEEPSQKNPEKPGTKTSSSEKSHSPVASIVILLVLLAILGGSGFGLWYILRSPSDKVSTENTSETSTQATPNQATGSISSPIEKAKAKIAKIPTAAAEEVLADLPDGSGPGVRPSSGSSSPSEPSFVIEETLPPSVSTAEASPAAPTVRAISAEEDYFEPAPLPPASQVDQSLIERVSVLLSQSHIGGVRRGGDPKVIFDGISYSTGDLVDPETGLRFAGIRKGKLAFKDANGIVYLKSF
jgi:hypothetical protein